MAEVHLFEAGANKDLGSEGSFTALKLTALMAMSRCAIVDRSRS